jgi:hypothetical protein
MARQNTNVQIIGVKETMIALKEFEPALRKKLNKEIRSSLDKVKTRAQTKYPKGDWKVKVTQKNLLGQVVATAGGGNASDQRWGDAPPGIRAAIFEFAGSTTTGATPQAKGLIESLTRRYGQPGRFLWSAWDEVGKSVLTEIEQAVKSAERDLQTKLDQAGERF